jgi:hypothetical protein
VIYGDKSQCVSFLQPWNARKSADGPKGKWSQNELSKSCLAPNTNNKTREFERSEYNKEWKTKEMFQ